MNPQQIMDGMAKKNRELTSANEQLSDLTESTAQKKRDYLVALTAQTTHLKIAGEKITLIPVLAKGEKRVADLGYAWDVSEGVLMACRERIKDIRSQIDSYRSLLTWLRAEMEMSGGPS